MAANGLEPPDPGAAPVPPAPAGSLEAWAVDFLSLPDPRDRLDLPPLVPGELPLEAELLARPAVDRRLFPPPRPAPFEAAPHTRRSVGNKALTSPRARVALLHTFLHHEVQAAELFAHGFLAFAEAPAEFRRGLLGLAQDELRHARAYRELLRARGVDYGDLPVRDWFWERVPKAPGPAGFLALVGLGLEGANLDHSARFSARLRAAGDGEAAALLAEIGAEEVAHVRFAIRWFQRFAGPLDVSLWRSLLPPPFSERTFVHRPIHRAARERAGFPIELLDQLERDPA